MLRNGGGNGPEYAVDLAIFVLSAMASLRNA